jgi:alginate O-acetyltransferase complex protein AlgI
VLFNSLAFFVFFPIVVTLFFVAPHRVRWIVLLAASLVFYAWWRPELLVLLFVSTAVGYAAGRALAREKAEPRRNLIVFLACVANFGMLAVFKFAHVSFLQHTFGTALPVGISFYTFQTIGYVLDIHRRQYEPEPHFGRFALFVSFFPHLVAGPIMRGSKLLPQFGKEHRWDFDRAVSGLGLILWGLFKKVVIADRAAYFVDAIYRDPTRYQGVSVIAATWLFAFQLYGDFSGYSDIAVGSARVLGFDLMDNFNRPYAARSMVQFWRRWHISFSTWFLDYVYVPLGLVLGRALPAGKTGRRIGTTIAVTIVFLLSGLWHGAETGYLLWGALQAVLVIGTVGVGLAWKRSGQKVSPVFRKIGSAVGIVLTFNLVCLGLVLFRATSFAHARVLFAQVPVDFHVSVLWELTHIGRSPPEAVAIDLAILVVSIVVLEIVQWVVANERIPAAPVRWIAWATLSVWVVLSAVQTHSPFIYFAF